jgi:hypothetical protein
MNILSLVLQRACTPAKMMVAVSACTRRASPGFGSPRQGQGDSSQDDVGLPIADGPDKKLSQADHSIGQVNLAVRPIRTRSILWV